LTWVKEVNLILEDNYLRIFHLEYNRRDFMPLLWSTEAEQAISRVPFFVRKRVRQRVENEARLSGADQVHLEHVRICQQTFLQQMDAEVKGWQLETCLGMHDCPHRAVAPQEVLRELEGLLAGKNLREFLKTRVNGPLRMHHEFRVSLSGCPNACSRPHIVDIGLIGAVLPVLTSELCSQCGQCAAVCREGAVAVDGNQVKLNLNACLKCGDCIKVCPSGTLVAGADGFRVLLGGKLGRHPQLGRELPKIYPLGEIVPLVDHCLNYYMEHYQAGQRFSDIVDRMNLPAL
jgi:anaerobic sulfite reductase subunit C